MENIAFKKVVLEAAKQKQQEIIDDFKRRIKELNSNEDTVEEDMLDRDKQASDASNDHLINGLADQVNFVIEEMNLLNRIQIGDTAHKQVSVGSIVRTDKQTFFPSVSIEKFEVNKQELFGISTKSPIYQVMKGKKTGDEFEYNKSEYKILEVY
jgi:transcription elongation GreA/GreB family factor